VNVLFGSIFGISTGDARLAAVIAVAVCLLLVLIARPLLFATLGPPRLPRARGPWPVRLLGFAFPGGWWVPPPRRPPRAVGRVACCWACWPPRPAWLSG